jgi:BlaI family transcriptional regulator, penicillinase repressor
MGRPVGRLTPAQHEIMDVVWQAGDTGASVTEIWTAIAESREVTRTTVLNLVDRLEKRGWLKRRKRQGTYHYLSAVPKEAAARGLAEEFVDDFFGGSAGELVMSLLGSKRLKKEDVLELRKRLDALLAESKSKNKK